MTNRQHKRTGGAIVLLIVAILLVMIAATQGLVRTEISTQQNERERAAAATLIRAIEFAKAVDHDWETAMTLPLDAGGKKVVLNLNGDKTELVATLMLDTIEIQTLQRPFRSDAPSKSEKAK